MKRMINKTMVYLFTIFLLLPLIVTVLRYFRAATEYKQELDQMSTITIMTDDNGDKQFIYDFKGASGMIYESYSISPNKLFVEPVLNFMDDNLWQHDATGSQVFNFALIFNVVYYYIVLLIAFTVLRLFTLLLTLCWREGR